MLGTSFPFIIIHTYYHVFIVITTLKLDKTQLDPILNLSALPNMSLREWMRADTNKPFYYKQMLIFLFYLTPLSHVQATKMCASFFDALNKYSQSFAFNLTVCIFLRDLMITFTQNSKDSSAEEPTLNWERQETDYFVAYSICDQINKIWASQQNHAGKPLHF